MNPVAWWISYWDRQVRKLGILDVMMVQGATIGFSLIVVKLFPRIMKLSVWWFAALFLVCEASVVYVLWTRKAGRSTSPLGSRKATPVGDG